MRRLIVAAVVAMLFVSVAHTAERKEVRVLFDFEDAKDLEELKAHSESLTLDIVQDNGVTSGANCLRAVAPPTVEWSVFEIHGDKLKDFDNFEYLALDVFSERNELFAMVMELWDKDSVNYATRCTYENIKVHVGAAVEEANAFLAALKKSIPAYPKIKNMTSPDAGALVGAGIDMPVAELTDAWRQKIAALLIALK